MQISQKGIDLIKKYEGVSLKAYPDPGTGGVPWTIGYGHTKGVKPQDKITALQAEQFLREDLKEFEEAVNDAVKVDLNQNEFDALVSFAFNVGANGFARSTMVKRLNNGEHKGKVFIEELPKYNQGGGRILLGLVNRRNAEKELAISPMTQAKIRDPMDPSFMVRAAQFFNGESHKIEAFRALEKEMPPDVLDRFMARYRGSQVPVEGKSSVGLFPLAVPYFGQYDSKTNMGDRMCFSSSMAMALDYVNSSAILGDDDWYLQTVLRFGDTVSSQAQVKAAESLGFNVNFKTNGNIKDLERQLDKGIPVPIGILHDGPISNPSGGGHWICLTGYDSNDFFVNDPAGSLDMINGRYKKPGISGHKLRYNKANLMKRWNIKNPNDGWWMEIIK